MVTKEQIQLWIDEGYQILLNGKPLKVDGNIWDYISTLDSSENSIFVLVEVINWEDEELANLQAMV